MINLPPRLGLLDLGNANAFGILLPPPTSKQNHQSQEAHFGNVCFGEISSLIKKVKKKTV
jgi:hypothetical protein